jgi:hypothetical protein
MHTTHTHLLHAVSFPSIVPHKLSSHGSCAADSSALCAYQAYTSLIPYFIRIHCSAIAQFPGVVCCRSSALCSGMACRRALAQIAMEGLRAAAAAIDPPIGKACGAQCPCTSSAPCAACCRCLGPSAALPRLPFPADIIVLRPDEVYCLEYGLIKSQS